MDRISGVRSCKPSSKTFVRGGVTMIALGLLTGCFTELGDAGDDDDTFHSIKQAVVLPGREMVWVEEYDGTSQAMIARIEGAVGMRWTANGNLNHCGTGTLISPDLFLTAAHCNYATGYTVAFNYQYDADGNPRTISEYEIIEELDKQESEDYSIVRLAGKPGLVHGWVRVGMYKPPVGERAYVVHHAQALRKRASEGYFVSHPSDDYVGHDAASLPGGSGGGVFDKYGRLLSMNNTHNSVKNWGVSVKRILEISPVAGEVLAYAAPCGGRTKAGDTNWVDYGSTGIYVDIDTSHCGFTSTPAYFTSLGGNQSHWLSQGGTSIYSATANGFRVFVKYPWGIDPAQANDWDWHINWEAVATGYRESSLCTGRTDDTWSDSSRADTVYKNVNTSSCGFSRTPKYFTSLVGGTKHWDTHGATAITQVDNNSFQIHVTRPGITAELAESYNWKVNWRAELDRDDNDGRLSDACVGNDSTGWKQYGSTSLYLDVDTSDCELATGTRSPLAFFNLVTDNRTRFPVSGLTSVYSPSATKFRVFFDAGESITPGDASDGGWKVSWRIRD